MALYSSPLRKWTVARPRLSPGLRIVFVAALLLITGAAQAADHSRLTASQLNEMCHSESNLDFGYCAGYVTAVADELLYASLGEYRACNHAAVKSQQYVDIFRNYVASYPEALGKPADLAAAAAFARAFPCAP
ncbi:MAG: Rap1a/Tai family immunity protein [Alphaproteobacteria bacterium]